MDRRQFSSSYDVSYEFLVQLDCPFRPRCLGHLICRRTKDDKSSTVDPHSVRRIVFGILQYRQRTVDAFLGFAWMVQASQGIRRVCQYRCLILTRSKIARHFPKPLDRHIVDRQRLPRIVVPSENSQTGRISSR